MKGYFICPTYGHVVGTRGRGPILCKDGHKGERRMDFVGEGEEGKREAYNQVYALNRNYRQQEEIEVRGKNPFNYLQLGSFIVEDPEGETL